MRSRSLALLLTLAACGARSSLREPDLAPADGAVVPASPCARLAEALCARLQQCAPAALSNGLTGGRAVGPEACVARVTIACDGWRSTPDLAASPDRVDACRAELTAASCGEVGWRYFTDGPVCDAWPRGGRPMGAACRLGAQCAGGQCSFGRDRGCGTCSSGITAPTQRAGEACDGRRQCRYWLRCEAGACAERAGLGEACDGDGDCDPSQGLGCDRTARRCIRRPVSPVGGSCLSQIVTDPAQPASPMCERGHACLNRNDFGQGRCAPLVGDGAACEPFDAACAYPARCQGGRCVLPSDVTCAP